MVGTGVPQTDAPGTSNDEGRQGTFIQGRESEHCRPTVILPAQNLGEYAIKIGQVLPFAGDETNGNDVAFPLTNTRVTAMFNDKPLASVNLFLRVEKVVVGTDGSSSARRFKGVLAWYCRSRELAPCHDCGRIVFRICKPYLWGGHATDVAEVHGKSGRASPGQRDDWVSLVLPWCFSQRMGHHLRLQMYLELGEHETPEDPASFRLNKGCDGWVEGRLNVGLTPRQTPRETTNVATMTLSTCKWLLDVMKRHFWRPNMATLARPSKQRG